MILIFPANKIRSFERISGTAVCGTMAFEVECYALVLFRQRTVRILRMSRKYRKEPVDIGQQS